MERSQRKAEEQQRIEKLRLQDEARWSQELDGLKVSTFQKLDNPSPNRLRVKWFDKLDRESKCALINGLIISALVALGLFVLRESVSAIRDGSEKQVTSKSEKTGKTVKITGEVFIALENGENLRLGAQPIIVYEVSQDLSDSKYVLRRMIREEGMNDHIKPIARGYTDSEGKFSIEFSSSADCVATLDTSRTLYKKTENYFWAEPATDGARLIFSNVNLID